MFTQTAWDNFTSKIMLFVPQAVTAAGLLLVFWIAAIITKRLIERAGRLRKVDPDLIEFLARTAKVGVLAFGVITALGTIGIHVTALVAGLGLTGFALGLALKDIISNAVSGILVIIYKPIKYGDSISVSSFQGTVVEMNLRYTVLRGTDVTIYVPNSSLLTSGITVQQTAATAAEEGI